jgi:hypothetical protein
MDHAVLTVISQGWVGMKLGVGPQNVVRYEDMSEPQVLRRLGVIAYGPNIRADLGLREDDSYFHGNPPKSR